MEQAQQLLQNVTFTHPMDPIPPFSDELLLNIFEYLTPDERLPLCLVCKRFRLLELQIGNRKFNNICVIMCDESNPFTNSPSDVIVPQMSSDYCYSFETKAGGDFEVVAPGIANFFKGTTTDILNFQIAKNREPKPSVTLLSLIDLIHYKEIFFYLHCESDFSGFLLSFFDNFKNDQITGVTFIWHTLKYQNLMWLNVAMELLPKLEVLCVFEDKNNITDEFLLNGQLMLTMIKAAPEIVLKSIDCTQKDLFKAFRIVCELSEHASVILFVVRTAAENLLTNAKEEGFVVEQDCVTDDTREFIMYIVNHSNDVSGKCTEVHIRRIDADGNIVEIET